MPFLGINISRGSESVQDVRSRTLRQAALIRSRRGQRTQRARRSQVPLNCLYSSGILEKSPLLRLLNKSPVMAIFINQAMFFLLCDKVLLSTRDKSLTALYSLLFYNVAAYLVSYGRELLVERNGSLTYVQVSEHSNVRHLALSATKMVLDVVKFVTFAITCVFILLVFGVPGHNQFSPTWCYIFITTLYYFITDPWTHDNASQALRWLQMDYFENLEVLWTPVIIRTFSAFSSGFLILLAWFFSTPSSLILIAAAAYVNVYMCLKELDIHWRVLKAEKSCLDKFRYATSNELLEKRDDVCAVCLTPMQWKARVTKCRHMFHSDCLRLCLKMYSQCPICKQAFEESLQG